MGITTTTGRGVCAICGGTFALTSGGRIAAAVSFDFVVEDADTEGSDADGSLVPDGGGAPRKRRRPPRYSASGTVMVPREGEGEDSDEGQIGVRHRQGTELPRSLTARPG